VNRRTSVVKYTRPKLLRGLAREGSGQDLEFSFLPAEFVAPPASRRHPTQT